MVKDNYIPSTVFVDKLPELCVNLELISVYDTQCYSATEMLYMLANKINSIICNMEHNDTALKAQLEDLNVKLEYLLGEGLADELQKIFERMYADGTLQQLIGESMIDIQYRLEKAEKNIKNMTKIIDLTEEPETNHSLLQKAINEGGELQLPTNQAFSISKPLIVNNPISIVGKDTTLIFEGNGFIVSSSGFKLNGVNLKQKKRNHALNTVAIKILKETEDKSKLIYTKDHLIRNLSIVDFTISLEMDSVYWLALENINTFRDKIGFKLNLDTRSNPNPTTTLKMDRVYFRGSGNEFVPVEGSIGMLINNVVNIEANTIASEWYQRCGRFYTIQAGTFINPYFELCDQGVEFHTISGSIVLINPYLNLLKDYGIKVSYGNITNIGGRAIMDDGSPLFEKKENSNIIFVKDIALTGGTTFKSNGYQNSNITDLSTGITLKDNGDFKIVNQGYKETIYSLKGIKTNLNDSPINITIGSNDVCNFKPEGLEFIINKSVILRSPDNSKFKIQVSNEGVLSASKIE